MMTLRVWRVFVRLWTTLFLVDSGPWSHIEISRSLAFIGRVARSAGLRCVDMYCHFAGVKVFFYPLDSVGDVNVEPSGYVTNIPEHDFAFRMLHDDIRMYNTLVQNHVGNCDGQHSCAQLSSRNCGAWWDGAILQTGWPLGWVIFR